MACGVMNSLSLIGPSPLQNTVLQKHSRTVQSPVPHQTSRALRPANLEGGFFFLIPHEEMGGHLIYQLDLPSRVSFRGVYVHFLVHR